MYKQTQTFSVNPPINLVEDGKCLLAVSPFECKNSVFNITNENNSFSITIPGHWGTKSHEKTINKLNKLLELRSLELHVREVRKWGTKTKTGNSEDKLSDFDTKKKRDNWRIKKWKYNLKLEDLNYRLQLSYD